YALTIDGDDEDLGATGDLDITDDLTIIGTLPPPSVHGSIERSFHIHSGATVTFDHIWLTDGSAIFGGGLINEGVTTLSSFTCNYNSVEIPPGGMGDAMGGCIFNTGELTILGAQFLANTAGFGGAIYNYENALMTIEDSNFIGSEADGHGGAIWNGHDAILNIDGGEFRMNEADVHGGGIWNNGSITGIDLYFEDNQAAGNGGGVFAWTDSFTTFTNTWFTLNTADLGGGLYNDNGMVHFYESGLTENTATGGAGGGIYNLGPAPPAGLLLKNVTVSNNTATGGLGGAGIYNNSNFDLRFITVAGNNPEGIRIDGGAEIKIRSSALANNPGGNCAGIPPDSQGHNIENDGTCGFAGWNDLPATDPLLEPLAAYAGMAPSHALGVSSPAIDSGDPDRCTAIDQHGTTRPQGAWCDRGAHENKGKLPDVSASGIVWHDLCAVPNATPATPPPGCIDLPGGGLGADGIYDPSEPGIGGLHVKIGTGPCPISLILTIVPTDINGEYSFPFLFPATYCITVDALIPPNDFILIPGNWTFPVRDASPAETEITIAANEHLVNVNFGWDYQFLPAAAGPGRNFCVVNRNAFLRLGPSSIDYPTVTGFLKGHIFEVLAISGPDRPGYYYGQDKALITGWIAKYLLDCEDLDDESLEVREAPPIPTPIPCTRDLPEEQCIAAGGTMSTGTTTAPYCICP
ncbi:MAG: hypothetical protein KAU23_06695, partial [Anaerolineales bacterium]|nr:hypothetical protein [Anaerolineales bacterium]